MRFRTNLGCGLAVGGALAVMGAAGATMTERALAAAPGPPAGVPETAPRTIDSPEAQNGQAVGPLAGPAVESTITVPGDGVVRDVDVRTFIRHTASSDLDVEITSPSGTTVKLIGGINTATIDSFDGTLWDDSAGTTATDGPYAPEGAAASLVPEGALGAFVGEPAAGEWTLRVTDVRDAEGDGQEHDGGTLDSWQLVLTTQDAVPALTETEHAAEPPEVLPIPDATAGDPPAEDEPAPVTPGTLTSTIEVSGAKGYLWDADLVTDVGHENVDDLRIRVTGPDGRTVVLSTDNSGDTGFYADRRFDDSADALVTTTTSTTDGVVPEGALSAFMGIDPNGTWTITVEDVLPGDEGSLDGWSLRLRSAEAGSSPGGTPVPPTPPATPAPPVTVSAAEACLPETAPRPRSRTAPGARAVTVSQAQLRINQRIYQAAVRRANAIQAWLDAGLVRQDLCGGAVGAKQLGAGITTGTLAAVQSLTPPAPRPIVVAQAQASGGARFELSSAQLLINQRVAQAGVRRANGLQGRLDGGLTGGDIRDGQITQDKLAAGLAITAARQAQAPAASTTQIASGRPGGGDAVRLSAAQLLINQRIGQAAIRRLNALTARIESGISASDIRASSVTADDLAPELRR